MGWRETLESSVFDGRWGRREGRGREGTENAARCQVPGQAEGDGPGEKREARNWEQLGAFGRSGDFYLFMLASTA